MKGKKVRSLLYLTSLTLIIVTSLVMGMLLFIPGVRISAAAVDVRNVYFETDGTGVELDYFQSISGGLLYAAGLGYTGADVNSRLIGPTGEIVYKFDLADDIENTVLQYASTFLNAKYSVDGTTYHDLTLDHVPENGTTHEVIWRYQLTETDALSGADNVFYIKFFNTAASDGYIHALSINSDLQTDVNFDANALTGLPYLVKTKSLIIYFVNGDTPSLYSMAADSEFVYAAKVDPEVTGVRPVVAGSAGAGVLTGYNFDNSATWTPYTAGDEIPVTSANTKIYFRSLFSAADNYNTSFSLELFKDYSGVGEEEVFFYADGNENEAKYFKTFTGLLYPTGLGWTGDENSRLCGPGNSIVYFFDLDDDIESAALTYTARFFEASYSFDGLTYTDLTADGQSYQGSSYETVYRYVLTEEDALSDSDNAWNRFYIKLTNTATSGDAFFHNFAIIGNTDAISESLVIRTADEGLKYYEAGKSMIYYPVGDDNTTASVYLAKDDFAVFKFNIDNGEDDFELEISSSAGTAVNIEYSFDKNTWNTYGSAISLTGKGAVPTVYVRLTALAETILETVTVKSADAEISDPTSESPQTSDSIPAILTVLLFSAFIVILATVKFRRVVNKA